MIEPSSLPPISIPPKSLGLVNQVVGARRAGSCREGHSRSWGLERPQGRRTQSSGVQGRGRFQKDREKENEVKQTLEVRAK